MNHARKIWDNTGYETRQSREIIDTLNEVKTFFEQPVRNIVIVMINLVVISQDSVSQTVGPDLLVGRERYFDESLNGLLL